MSGDDAVFADIAVGRADNERLLDNIIAFMTAMATSWDRIGPTGDRRSSAGQASDERA